MTQNQTLLLKEIQNREKIVCLHAIDQPLTDDLVRIILDLSEQIVKLNEQITDTTQT